MISLDFKLNNLNLLVDYIIRRNRHSRKLSLFYNFPSHKIRIPCTIHSQKFIVPCVSSGSTHIISSTLPHTVLYSKVSILSLSRHQNVSYYSSNLDSESYVPSITSLNLYPHCTK